jgi:hypothetical protein
VNSALVVKTLQVRQQGGLRESHRFWCWPQRSSHGQDQLGYRSCTLTPRPAPKSTTTLFYIAVSFLLFFLRKSRGEVLKKKLVLTFLGFERRTPGPFAKRARRGVLRRHRSRLSEGRGRVVRCVTRPRGTHIGSFRRGAEKSGPGARTPHYRSPIGNHQSLLSPYSRWRRVRLRDTASRWSRPRRRRWTWPW